MENIECPVCKSNDIKHIKEVVSEIKWNPHFQEDENEDLNIYRNFYECTNDHKFYTYQSGPIKKTIF